MTCRASGPTQAARAEARLGDAGEVSDADAAIAATLAADFEEIQTGAGIQLAVTIDTDRPLPATVDDLAVALDRAVRAP